MTENEAIKIINGIDEVRGELPEDGNDVDLALMMAKDALEKVQALEENKTYEIYRQYISIGTVEEFKALKEKAEPKKIVAKKKTRTYLGTDYYCPTCGERQLTAYTLTKGDNCCKDCGQKLDWE